MIIINLFLRMDEIFADFRQAQTMGSGPLLSTTIIPIAPISSPNRLRAFVRSTTEYKVKADIDAQILHNRQAGFRLSKAEGAAWADLYVAYWYFLRELLALEDRRKNNENRNSNDAGWTKIYEGWKELTNVLIRGYSNYGFEAWTVPCLYVAGKYLRIYAIKADEKGKDEKGSKGTFTAGFQEDVVGDMGKNEKLEDAGRVMNRIFQLCISDRYVAIKILLEHRMREDRG